MGAQGANHSLGLNVEKSLGRSLKRSRSREVGQGAQAVWSW